MQSLLLTKKIVLCVASSDVAALLLPEGVISHSRFQIPLIVNDSICRFTRTSFYEVLKWTALIIWDEGPMQNKHRFGAVLRALTDLLDNKSLFGGIPAVLGGNFTQILQVLKHRKP